jgi:ABC-type glutathione transport system ATPase component
MAGAESFGGHAMASLDSQVRSLLGTSADNPRSLLSLTNERETTHLFVSHCMKTVDKAQQP